MIITIQASSYVLSTLKCAFRVFIFLMLLITTCAEYSYTPQLKSDLAEAQIG